jgi:hypothetical protein
MSTPADEKPQEATAVEKLAHAYAVVFGRDDEHRTDAQRMVWQDMEHRGYIHRSTAVALPDQSVLPCKMEIAEGCRIFQLDTQRHIHRAKSLGTVKKPKNKILRS